MLDSQAHLRRKTLARELYAAHSEELLVFFCSMRRMPAQDAIDLLQQTFLELLATLERHPELEIQFPRAFLFKIASRQLGASLERARRRPTIEPGASVDRQSAAETADLERLASMRAEQRILLRALRHLSTEDEVGLDQLLLYLRFWAGLTLAEVAEIVGMTPAAASGRQRRSLQRLRQHMQQLEGAEPGPLRTSTATLHKWREALEQAAKESRPK